MWGHGLVRPGSRKGQVVDSCECTKSLTLMQVTKICDHVFIHLSTMATTTQEFHEQ